MTHYDHTSRGCNICILLVFALYDRGSKCNFRRVTGRRTDRRTPASSGKNEKNAYDRAGLIPLTFAFQLGRVKDKLGLKFPSRGDNLPGIQYITPPRITRSRAGGAGAGFINATPGRQVLCEHPIYWTPPRGQTTKRVEEKERRKFCISTTTTIFTPSISICQNK